MANTEVGSAYVTIYPQTDGNFSKQVGQDMAKGVGGGLSSKAVALGNILSNVALRAADAAASAIGEVIGGAFENFANYEQLVGGVETLFKDSADTVKQYAQDAYRTAGLSANQYMETVTSFSASLLQSLDGDTAAAARYADMAITDMSDNANKMGSDMESIQNAYQGFAKQNYTMLDNLKLGYGGTKSEMERLLADASELAGVEFNIDSYSDVIQAIHVMQEEMDIAGTTAAEASQTVSGSIDSMKAAWDNWLTSLGAEDIDFNQATQRLVEAATTAAQNAAAAMGRIFQTAITALLGEENATALFDALSGIFDTLQGAAQRLAPVLQKVGGIVGQALVVAFQALDAVLQPVGAALSWLWDNILAPLGSFLESVFVPAFDGLIEVFERGDEIIGGVVDSLGAAWDELASAASDAFGGIADTIGGAFDAIGETVTDAGGAIVDTIGGAWDAVVRNTANAYKTAKANIQRNLESARQAVVPIAENIGRTLGFPGLGEKVNSVFRAVQKFMEDPIGNALNFIKSIPSQIVGFFQGLGGQITSAIGSIKFPTPHITWEDLDIGGVKLIKLPHVSWYASGGFVDSPTLIGAGEAGAEMVLPRSGRMMDEFADAVASRMGGQSVVVNLQYDASADANELANDLAAILGRKLAMEG